MLQVQENLMSVSERNLVNFNFGDNVYELAGGLIPEIAERLDVPLAAEPNSGDLQAIMNKVGPNKIIRYNKEITAIDGPAMYEMVIRSGLQDAINRSLLNADLRANPDTVDSILEVTCVANWQDEALQALPDNLIDKPVYNLGGIRPMDTATEKINKNVTAMHEIFKRYPLEAEYAGSIILPQMIQRGFRAIPIRYETKIGDELLEGLFRDNPHLLDERLVLVRNANAGIISAIQMRNAARKFNSDFDTDPSRPQALVITGAKTLAETEEQETTEQSVNFQKRGTALRQVVLTAKAVHEAGSGE